MMMKKVTMKEVLKKKAGMTEVKDMTEDEKKKVMNLMYEKKNISAGSGKIESDKIIIEKGGYTNKYKWEVVAWDFATNHPRYGRWSGQRF
jgi:hypothetical protein